MNNLGLSQEGLELMVMLAEFMAEHAPDPREGEKILALVCGQSVGVRGGSLNDILPALAIGFRVGCND